MLLMMLTNRKLFVSNIICLHIKLRTKIKNKSLLSNVYLLTNDFL